jgi:uncharacterized protein YjdB
LLGVTPTAPQIAAGFARQMAAAAVFEGASLPATGCGWSSSNPSVAAVDADGLMTAVAAGTAPIQATYLGATASTTVMVTTAVLVSITISPNTPAVARGATLQLSATGTFSNGSSLDVTGQVTWTSSSPSVASITAEGMAIGVSGGSTTIGAAHGGVQGTATLFAGS